MALSHPPAHLTPTAARATAAVALVTLLAGCGETKLNTARGERKIAAVVLQHTGQRVTADCPRDVPMRKGERTTCTVTARDGSHAGVEMVQTDDKGNVHISSMLMATRTVEDKVARDASRKLGVGVRIDCPDIVDVTGEARVRCRATDTTGQSAPAFVTISAGGNVSYRIPPAG